MNLYRRGQAVWALWRAFSRAAVDVPKPFSRRVSMLTELDVPISGKDRPGRSGVDNEYTAEQVFELGVALMLLDAGMKQTEAAFFVQHIRDDLQQAYMRIMSSPPAPRNVISPEERPNSPTRTLDDGVKVADTSCFLTFHLVEMREALTGLKLDPGPHPFWHGAGDPPLIFGPRFHFGLQSLHKELDEVAAGVSDKIRTVIELGTFAVLISEGLTVAPKVRRGRS